MNAIHVSSTIRNLTQTMKLSIQVFILVCLFGCCSNREAEPSGTIAKFGNTPIIDGVFTQGEWDDANIVQISKKERFWLKHDNTNLYFAFANDGGNLYLKKNTVIKVLHTSAQLGAAEYIQADSMTFSLKNTFDWQLYGLQHESSMRINETIADYLADNGWVASIGPLGNFAQAEWAVSFESMGITDTSQRFVETPGLFIFSTRMRLSPEEKKALMALPPEERKNQYPPLYWPKPPVPNDSLNNGLCPKKIRIDSTEWNTIWIDFKSRNTTKQ